TCRHELVRGLADRLAAAAEELHGVGDDLHRLTLGAVLRLPLAPLEAPVDRDRAALREVLGAVLALVAPDGDVEVVRLLGPFAGGAVLTARVDGEPEAAYGGPAGRVPGLGVASQVSDEDDAIDVGHVFAPSRSGGTRLLRGPVVVIGGRGHGRGRRRRLRLPALDTPDCQVAHDAVGDLEDARDLGQRRRRRREEKQVVDPLALVTDLVRQLAAAPRLVAVPAAAVGLDAL